MMGQIIGSVIAAGYSAGHAVVRESVVKNIDMAMDGFRLLNSTSSGASLMEWSEEAIARLRVLWDEGHSTAEIGRRLGCSKNAVISKSHRIDLPARPSPVRQLQPGQQPIHVKAHVPVKRSLPPLPSLQVPSGQCGADHIGTAAEARRSSGHGRASRASARLLPGLSVGGVAEAHSVLRQAGGTGIVLRGSRSDRLPQAREGCGVVQTGMPDTVNASRPRCAACDRLSVLRRLEIDVFRDRRANSAIRRLDRARKRWDLQMRRC